MDVADGQSGRGWALISGTSCPPWAGRDGPFFLHEVYQSSDPLGTSRITMPVLWDKQLGCIVSNDSWCVPLPRPPFALPPSRPRASPTRPPYSTPLLAPRPHTACSRYAAPALRARTRARTED